MPKRSSKPPADPNKAAAAVLKALTDDPAVEATVKNPAAVALGRLGGLKGGKARKDSLSPEKRSEIAKKAAAARWGATNPEESES